MIETVRIETEDGDGYNLPASRQSKVDGLVGEAYFEVSHDASYFFCRKVCKFL